MALSGLGARNAQLWASQMSDDVSVWREALAQENKHNAQVVALRIEHARFKMALESIAVNTCCDKCREAALVARAALSAPKRV